MDNTTREVKELYERYPFPGEGVGYALEAALNVVNYVMARAADYDNFAGIKVLDAGCGTGGTTAMMAMMFPQANITGIDLSKTSIETARRRGEAQGLSNVRFQTANLLELKLGEEFDIILCSGVLHVLSDASQGLQRLTDHLTPRGRMIVWLYGRHGRHHLTVNQSMLRRLFGDSTPIADQIRLTQAMLAHPKASDRLRCYFSTATDEVDGDWQKSVAWLEGKPAWILDQFLFRHEQVYTIDELLQISQACHLRIDAWLGVDLDIRAYTDASEVHQLYERLSAADRMRAIDRLLKPHSYTLALAHNT